MPQHRTGSAAPYCQPCGPYSEESSVKEDSTDRKDAADGTSGEEGGERASFRARTQHQ